MGFGTSTRRSPPNLQNQHTLTSEGALNYHRYDRSLQNAFVGGERLERYNPGKSVTREIRPLAVLITSESRAQYTALNENRMN